MLMTSKQQQSPQNTPSLFIRWFGSWNHWTTFEKSWMVLFTVINISVFFAVDDTILGLIISLTGMICVVMVAKGLIGNYLFGIVQVSLYGYLSYKYGLYGEAMLNLAFYLPTQFIGIWVWNKRKVTVKDTDEVIARKLTTLQATLITVAAIGLIAGYAWLLSVIGGAEVGLDSATTVLSVIAQILMIMRFREQWLIWILVNALSIVMWVFTLNGQDGTSWTVVVMWSAFLINSVYGYWNWSRMAANQKEVV